MAKSDFKFCFLFRVRYAETDAQGIVFFAHYLTYFDTAINEYLRDLPHNYIEHVKQTGTDFHVVKVTIEFYAPSHFDDEIEVSVAPRSMLEMARVDTAGSCRQFAQTRRRWCGSGAGTSLPRHY